jgi:DNA-binding transcriptional regulator YiaG
MSQFPPGWLAHDVALAAAKVAEWKSIKDMTPKQYAAAIEALGLSQRAAGAFLGVDERTSRRWVLGESAIPESAAKLLRLMVRLKLSPDDVN